MTYNPAKPPSPTPAVLLGGDDVADGGADKDPVRIRHRDLERIANVALQIGCSLTQSGACVRVVHEGARMVVAGLGVEVMGLRSGYASFEITVGAGGNTITRMMQVGRHGVNHRLDFAIRDLALRTSRGGIAPDEVEAELAHVVTTTPRHPSWVVAVATGTACAAFGRLLGVDWPAFLPILAAGSIGQGMRHHLLARGVNIFVVAALIACLSALFGGIGAQAAGSSTVTMAMMASILLLVPGVPCTNAQTDIMDGYPTMGSARAVWVIMVMAFATTGIWLAESLLGVRS